MKPLTQIWQLVYRSHRGVSILICRFTVVMMMACLSFGFARMVYRISQEVGSAANVDYLTLFAMIVSVEAMYTQRRAADLDGREKWIFRISEALTLIILLKLFVLLRAGPAVMLAEVSSWQANFSSSFFSAEFIAGGFILALIWFISTNVSNDIDDLHDREQDATWDELGKVQNALHLIRDRIMVYAFSAGGLVLFFAVASRLNFRSFIPILNDRFDPSVPIVNVLLYFVLTLVLLSQTQFALLRTRWLWNKTPVATNLARNWIVFGSIFFVALALLSFILPTNYSLGFFDTLRYALQMLGEVFRFLISLILLPLTICARLFPAQEGPVQGSMPAAETPPPPPVVDGSPSSLWQFIQSLLFWGTLVGVVVFALSQYIKANGYLLRKLSRLAFLQWFSQIFRAIWAWLVSANKTMSVVIGATLRRLRPPSSTTRRLEQLFRRPGGRTPREQVFEIYLSLIDLGRKFGPARRDGETPYHYSREVIVAHPGVSTEVLDLTEAFNEARYSDHEVQPDSVKTLRSKWDRIRDDLIHEDSPDDPRDPNSDT